MSTWLFKHRSLTSTSLGHCDCDLATCDPVLGTIQNIPDDLAVHSVSLWCRCVWTGQSSTGGARSGTGERHADGVLCVGVRWRPWQVRPAAGTTQWTAACQPLNRGIPLHVRDDCRQHSAHGDDSLATDVTHRTFQRTLAKYSWPTLFCL